MSAIHDLAAVSKRLIDLQARRDELVVQSRQDGATFRDIADAARLSPAGVLKITRRSL